MGKKTIAFIEPSSNKTNVFENFMRLPLMGTLYLGTILHNEGYDVRIYNENIMSSRFDPFETDADVYCISALTVSSNRGRLLAQEIRRIHPDAKVIFGGTHASLVPGDFEEFADHVVFGEAESVIADLVEGKFSEKIIQGAPVEDLDELPLANYGLLEEVSSMDVVPMMTSRGCPFDCNFCTVTKIFGKRFRMQSPERIIREIKHIKEFFDRPLVFFYDDNFTANRGRVRKLCALFKEEGINIKWTAQVRSDLARDRELVKQMADNGCRRFYVGFESIHDETLKAMHKGQTRQDIERSIRTFHEHGICIHGMFIFGEDHDTPGTIRDTVEFSMQQHIDTLQFMILTPFPGTRCYEDLVKQDRLIHKQWDYYDGLYAVFRPRNMSAARLQQETLKAYKRFYSLRRVSLETLRLIMDLMMDALTFNFSRVFLYTLDTFFPRAGARFIVGRYARTFKPYVEFLERIEQKKVIKDL
ncbi:B12-binding domain-containing radical SAM protein [Fibrobacterota bacterium]